MRSALRLISQDSSVGILSLGQVMEGKTVGEILKEKHPPAQPASPSALLPPEVNSTNTHRVLFEMINGDLILSTALKTQGAAGPSGMDSAGWRRICTTFHSCSTDLCNAIAAVTQRICTSFVDPSCLAALTACRLIPLSKNPGVRPIGICETLRRIICKAALLATKADIQSAAGPLQVCAGHEAGCEAAIHAMQEIFADEETEGVLLVDAKNAFNSLNRGVALHNCRVLCPSLAPILINMYRNNADLFVAGVSIASQEGTTQGDPLAMAMYALGILPLIRAVATQGAKQVWYADDATASGQLTNIRNWWDQLTTDGPSFGYHVNNEKSWLIVKEEHLEQAERTFEGTGIKITSEGKRHLGSALGISNRRKSKLGWQRLVSYRQSLNLSPTPLTRHSLHLSAPITNLIVQQSEVLGDASDQQQAVKASICVERQNQQKRVA